MLRDRQQLLYDWLFEYFEREGRSPTIREIKDGLGYTSSAPVQSLLLRLKTQRQITYTAHEARSIRLVGYRLVLTKEEEKAA